MKPLSTFFSILLFTTSLFAQDSIDCFSNEMFQLEPAFKSRDGYIKFKSNQIEVKRKFLNDDKDEYQCFLTQLIGNNTNELIIRWSEKFAGTGGRHEEKGIQIWSIKNQKRLFKAKTYCREESFGRQDADRYVIKEKRPIKIQGQEIWIDSIKSEYKGNWKGHKPSFCKLDSIKPGTYKVEFNGIKENNTASYILSNESALLAFRTKNNKKLVIAKDTGNKYLTYRFGMPNKIELEYPKNKTNNWRQFKFSYYFRGGGVENEGVDFNYLYFKKGNYRYVVYQEYTARSEETKYGIKVINLKTKETTKIKAKPSTVEGSLGELRDNDKIKEGDKLFD